MKQVNNYFIYVSSLKLKNIFWLQDQLNGLTMLPIYRGMSLTAEEVIGELGQMPSQLEILKIFVHKFKCILFYKAHPHPLKNPVYAPLMNCNHV